MSRWEVACVLLTGLGHFLLAGWLRLQLAFIVGACIFWTGFVVARAAMNPSILAQWGFARRNLGRGLALLAPVAVVTVSGFAAYGMLTGKMVLHWHIVVVGLLYPVWGLVQQFLIVALLAGGIEKHTRISKEGIALLTAMVFAAAHVPALPLVVAAFCLALITTSAYFRHRNLWALGLFHGWFATGLYYFALGQDLWAAVVSARSWP